MNTYQHTHVSLRDYSPAMMVSETADTITLVNEDGYEWTDPKIHWAHVDDEPLNFSDEDDEDDYPPSQSGAEFMAAYYSSDSYINYLNG